MKVKIKLFANQVVRAKNVISAIEKRDEYLKSDGWESLQVSGTRYYKNNEYTHCGDLLGYEMLDSCFNSNQKLSLIDGYLEYHGERCPLLHDQGMPTLLYIIHGKKLVDDKNQSILDTITDIRSRLYKGKLNLHALVGRIPTAAYDTSDKRLKWYETLQSYMCSRAPVWQVMPYLTNNYFNKSYYSQVGDTEKRVGAVRRDFANLPDEDLELLCDVVRHITDPRKLNAMRPDWLRRDDEIKLRNRVVECITMVSEIH